jgi:two-component system, NtrC family, sensor kinase
MKLAAKLCSVLLLGVIVILLVDAYISFRRQVGALEESMTLDAHLIGVTMKSLVTDVWRMHGRQRALGLIQDANASSRSLEMRWVRLDAPPGDAYAPTAPRERLKPVLQGQEVSFRERNKQGRQRLYTYVPIPVAEERHGAIELSQSLSRLDAEIHVAFIRSSILVAVLVLLSGVLVPLLGLKMVGHPLRRIIEKMRRMSTSDFSRPLSLPGHDEFSELAAGLNKMGEELQEVWEKLRIETEARITALEQLRHEERLSTVGRLASGIAHELGTPLNVISGRAGMIAKGNLPAEDAAENANTIKAQSERITTIIRQLLDFARQRTTKRVSVDLGQVVRRAVDFMSLLGRQQKADLRFVGQETPMLADVDTEQIQQVLINMIMNAFQAMPNGGKVEVGIRYERARPPDRSEGPKEECLCVYILDDGEGISQDDIGHIFEPFFTTKGVGKGTGLGLSIAYGIVREHGGWISVKSEPGQGCCFSIYLPRKSD